MEGFTPTFFLQLVIAIGGIFGAYFAVKSDIRNLTQRLEDHISITHVEVQRRLDHTSKSVHDIRDRDLTPLTRDVAEIKGKLSANN